jgi:hypothetical protein
MELRIHGALFFETIKHTILKIQKNPKKISGCR